MIKLVRAAEAGHLSATLSSLRADWARSHQSGWPLNLIKPDPAYQAGVSVWGCYNFHEDQRYQVLEENDTFG